MLTSFTFWSVVLAVLIAYLGVSVWLRRKAVARAEDVRRRAFEQEHPPRAFDSSALAPKIECVRQDYAASAHRRRRPSYCRAELFAAARRLVTGFAYFHRSTHEQDLHKHDA
jgi:hypothetical protein